jgi:glycosyltransferase involved in cell wall biosynthesis
MQQAGLKRSKLQLVPNWVDYEQFQRDTRQHASTPLPFVGKLDGHIAVVYLANFNPRKGHTYLLQAASLVINVHPECVFVLAGEGPTLPQMRSLAINLGLANHTLFPGRLPIEQVPALLHRAQIGVIASLSETFGWTIVEPLLADRPVVTTDVGFAADLATAGGVLMVPKRNSRALADALTKLIESPEMGQEIAKRGKAFVLENCEIHKVSQRYLEIYNACLKQNLAS